jgi:hypothetical protein
VVERKCNKCFGSGMLYTSFRQYFAGCTRAKFEKVAQFMFMVIRDYYHGYPSHGYPSQWNSALHDLFMRTLIAQGEITQVSHKMYQYIAVACIDEVLTNFAGKIGTWELCRGFEGSNDELEREMRVAVRQAPDSASLTVLRMSLPPGPQSSDA